MLHPLRREFVKGLGALVGSAALLGYDFRLANADPSTRDDKTENYRERSHLHSTTDHRARAPIR